MNITAIIAEYNPFHKGHLYQLEKARKETDADYVVIVLSGNFVQRGAPAIINKYERTKAALLSGADLVLELPVYYATSSAEYFAMGAVSLLDKLGCVNYLSFGSEQGSTKVLTDIAKKTLHETPAYQEKLNTYLKQGRNYAYANACAVVEQTDTNCSIESIIKEPNNILGIAYIKSILMLNSTITPHTILRKGSGYHSTGNNSFSSSSVRHALIKQDSLLSISKQIPEHVYSQLTDAYLKSFPILEDDFSDILSYKLRELFFQSALTGNGNNSAKSLTAYADVSDNLAGRICASMNQYHSFSQFCTLLKSKDLTGTRISRALLHILLDIKKNRLYEYTQDGYISYARELGFKKEAAPLLSTIKNNSSIPLISKLADAQRILGDSATYDMLLEDIHASEIYEQIASRKYNHKFCSEYSQQIISF